MNSLKQKVIDIDGISISLLVDDEQKEIWISQKEITKLYGKSKSTIYELLRQIMQLEKLESTRTHTGMYPESRTKNKPRKVKHYDHFVLYKIDENSF